jgi:hypothetical protein
LQKEERIDRLIAGAWARFRRAENIARRMQPDGKNSPPLLQRKPRIAS